MNSLQRIILYSKTMNFQSKNHLIISYYIFTSPIYFEYNSYPNSLFGYPHLKNSQGLFYSGIILKCLK